MKFPFQVWLDTELKVIHTGPSCGGAKIPAKYGYLRTEYIRTMEQAKKLDEEYRACEACKTALFASRRETVRSTRYTKRKGENEN